MKTIYLKDHIYHVCKIISKEYPVNDFPTLVKGWIVELAIDWFVLGRGRQRTANAILDVLRKHENSDQGTLLVALDALRDKEIDEWDIFKMNLSGRRFR